MFHCSVFYYKSLFHKVYKHILLCYTKVTNKLYTPTPISKYTLSDIYDLIYISQYPYSNLYYLIDISYKLYPNLYLRETTLRGCDCLRHTTENYLYMLPFSIFMRSTQAHKELKRLRKYAPHKKKAIYLLECSLIKNQGKGYSQLIQPFHKKCPTSPRIEQRVLGTREALSLRTHTELKRESLSRYPTHKVTFRGDI